MAYEQEAVLLARIALVFVYLYMMLFFRKNYLKSKEAGFVNRFFLGYALFFGALFIFQIGIAFNEIMGVVDSTLVAWVRAGFPDPRPQDVPVLSNMVLPLYILGLIAMLSVIAAQVYPVEQTIGWTRTPGTFILAILAGSMTLVFVPALTWTLLTAVLLFAAIGGVLYGLLLNISVNIKLAVVSTGDLRLRSIAIIFASFLFYIGFIYTLEVKEISLGEIFGIAGFSMKWDLVFGSVLQGLSALLYRQGLRSRG